MNFIKFRHQIFVKLILFYYFYFLLKMTYDNACINFQVLDLKFIMLSSTSKKKFIFYNYQISINSLKKSLLKIILCLENDYIVQYH